MAEYRIEITQSAVKELNRLPKQDLRRVVRKIAALTDNPRPDGCVKLSVEEKYRFRVGSYRVLYAIEEDALVVYVVKIAHGKVAYRQRPFGFAL